jgi:hypothetical protein
MRAQFEKKSDDEILAELRRPSDTPLACKVLAHSSWYGPRTNELAAEARKLDHLGDCTPEHAKCASFGHPVATTQYNECRSKLKEFAGDPASSAAWIAIEECNARGRRGEFSARAALAQCSNPGIIEAYRKSGYPHIDLIGIFAAHRLVLAEKLDRREITEAEAQLDMARTISAISHEETARINAATSLATHAAFAQAAQAQAAGTLMSGFSAYNQLLIPQPIYAPRPVINCYRNGPYTTCQ